FGLSVSDDTIYRALKTLGFSHVSARPKAYRQNAEAMDAFKKTSPSVCGNPCAARTRHTGRQADLPLGHERLAPPCRPRSKDPIDLSVRCGLPRTRSWRRPRAAGLQHRSYAASPRRDRNQNHSGRSRYSPPRSSRLAWRQGPPGSKQHLALAAPATRTRTQRPRKYLAIHAAELVVEPNFQILRRYRRSLLLRLEHAHRSAVENHVHRPPRLGSRRSLNLRIGISVALSAYDP